MKLTPCPSLLEELIRLANLGEAPTAKENLQAIARAFRTKKQRHIQVESTVTINVNLADGKISASLDDLGKALDQIDDEGSRIDLIRECPICSDIFWAGRSDKQACDRHVVRWRKQEWRRNNKEKIEKRAKAKARQAKSRIDRADRRLSKTSVMILEAIANHQNLFETIDEYCFRQLNRSRRFEGSPYSKPTVRRCLNLLVAADYITSTEREDGEFWYTLRNKAKKVLKPATH